MQCLAQHFVRRVTEICLVGGSDLDIAPVGIIEMIHRHTGEQGAQFDSDRRNASSTCLRSVMSWMTLKTQV